MENENVVLESEPVKPKKKKKFLKKLLIFIIVVAIIIVSLGFLFPGLLWPRSLGIKYTKADYDSIMNKLDYVKDISPTKGDRDNYTYTYGDLKTINVEFTSEEITAFLNENRPDYFAVKNVQVRINKDGSIEASGQANVDYFLNEVLGGKYSKAEIEKEIPALGLLPKYVNLYVKATGSIVNNKSSISISGASVQGVSIPSKYINNEANSTISNGVDNLMSKYSASSKAKFTSLKIEDGKLKFNGSVPSSLTRIAK